MVQDKSLNKISFFVRNEGNKVSKFLYNNPSANETFFKNLLDKNHIEYKFQKVFFKSAGEHKKSVAYYIAQFWIYKKKLFVEVSPGDRPKNIRCTDFRTFDALEVFPKSQCIKLTDNDIKDEEFLSNFMKMLKK